MPAIEFRPDPGFPGFAASRASMEVFPGEVRVLQRSTRSAASAALAA
jgi:hypothetical protein